MSASKYPTISFIIPMLTRLLQMFTIYDCKVDSINKLASHLYDDLNERAQPFLDKIMCITATYLDPRFRKSNSFLKSKKEMSIVSEPSSM
jgi:hypothetical protein